MAPRVLRLSRSRARQIDQWARREYPLEACGLLLGHSGDSGVEVLEVEQLANVAGERAHERYALDPLQQMRVEEKANGRGLDLVGVWHSHPKHGARPSETDRAAAWEGYSYLIVASAPDGDRQLRSWRLQEDRFVEERVEFTTEMR